MSQSGIYIIRNEKDIKKGTGLLVASCPDIRRAYEQVGEPPLRLREPGFMGLARIVVGQQVSVASAAAIWMRFEKVAGDESTALLRCLDFSDEDFKNCGLSKPKIRTIRAICHAIEAGKLELEALGSRSPEDIHEILTSIHGIGPWTADIYAMFCLGHSDAWAGGDLALQYAVQEIFGMDDRPSPRLMTETAERWRPWRGVAARILWAYYSDMKANKSGIPV